MVITPTNKSKNVIASVVDSEAITVHRLFSLSPQVDILELDLKELNFIQKMLYIYNIKQFGLLMNVVWLMIIYIN